jgi:hypothetical protein
MELVHTSNPAAPTLQSMLLVPPLSGSFEKKRIQMAVTKTAMELQSCPMRLPISLMPSGRTSPQTVLSTGSLVFVSMVSIVF